MLLLREPEDDIDVQTARSCSSEEDISAGLAQKRADASSQKQRGEEQPVGPSRP